jgi:DNA topoisomerase-2
MEWEKLTHREHILKRPDTYVGSLEFDPVLGMSPGLYKIIDEILVNAFDEYIRDPKKMSEIHVGATLPSGSGPTRITVSNNKCIPVVMHPKENVYVPELIFGHLLTSSNYDDTKDRFTGGRNGYGAKLTNIFSSEFKITSCDPENGIEYTQVWRDNMSVCEKPKLKKYTKKTGWLHIEFVPDETKLGKLCIDVLKRRAIEISLWGPRVKFNDEIVNPQSFEEFARGYIDERTPTIAHHKQGNWEVVVARSYDGFQHMSYVNGVATSLGGTHVDHVVNILCKGIGGDIKPYQFKQHIHLFVKVLLNKPTFSSQTKTECTSKITDPVEFKPKFLKDVSSLGIDEILSASKLKKSDGVKRARIVGIPKLDDANWAGTPKSDQCSLILTEGDSAKALAISGLSVVGRDCYGVYPLKGKPKNVRDSSVKQLETNKEFSDIKKILGLKQNENYKNTKTLRYGQVIIMTDADLDGSHIKGLVLNMFHVFWPSLLELGFVKAMVTPVIKVGKNWYFTENEYRSSGITGVPKYYKGLGTSTSSEAKEYFKMLDRLVVKFKHDPKMDDSMTLAFAKDRVPDRKEWLKTHMGLQVKPHVPYGHITQLTITDFITKDQVKFSEEDIRRSIPHIMDGLKPSQRKVIFACLKRNLERDTTVAQLAGYIGEHSAYHHGEASLQGTIVGLAQDFVGSNNMNLLVPSGQFGSRLEGGKDSASARYISTRLSQHTKKIFDERDAPVLNWLSEDAKSIEPEFYCPTIPMVLVNGCEGIGTGYSTFIPPYKLGDIQANLRRLLNKEPLVSMTPWYKGFNGTVTRKDKHTWIFTGTVKGQRITELPPGKWIQSYKEFLDTLVESGKIRGFENHSTETTPNFLIHGPVPSEDDLKLSTAIHTSNMCLMTATGIKKFESPEEILVEYARTRLVYYKLRKKHMRDSITERLSLLQTKARFIELVIAGRIEIFRRTKKQIEDAMKVNNLEEKHHDSLLNIKTYQYTLEEIEKLQKQLEESRSELDTINTTTIADMWKNDLSLVQE